MTQQQTKPAIPLQEAVPLANRLREELLPYCHRVWTAGSIRRRKEFVGDIELVCIPKRGEISEAPEPQGQIDLFGGVAPNTAPQEPPDLLTQYLDRECSLSFSAWDKRPAVNGRTSFGPRNKLLLYDGTPVDVFSGTWASFGMLFFVRTGDAGWVRQAMAEFMRQKRHGHPYGGVGYYVEGGALKRGSIEAEYLCATEERVFDLLGWPFTNPWDRTEERATELRKKLH